MSTPNNTAPDFGEPWQNELGDFEIYPRTGGDAVAYAEGAKTRDRVIACVNACAGMANPAAEIQAMRDAVKEAREELQAMRDERNQLSRDLSSLLAGDCLNGHDAVEGVRNGIAMREAIKEAHEALDNCIEFINDAQIIEAQWHWEPVKQSKAALAKLQPFIKP